MGETETAHCSHCSGSFRIKRSRAQSGTHSSSHFVTCCQNFLNLITLFSYAGLAEKADLIARLKEALCDEPKSNSSHSPAACDEASISAVASFTISQVYFSFLSAFTLF